MKERKEMIGWGEEMRDRRERGSWWEGREGERGGHIHKDVETED